MRSQPPGHFSQLGNGPLNGSSPALNAHRAVIIPVEGPYAYDPAGQARSSGLRRLSRLTWRATQLGTLATVGFAVVFARTAPAATVPGHPAPTASAAPATSASPSPSPSPTPTVHPHRHHRHPKAAATAPAAAPSQSLAPPTTPPAPPPSPTPSPVQTTSSPSHGGG